MKSFADISRGVWPQVQSSYFAELLSVAAAERTSLFAQNTWCKKSKILGDIGRVCSFCFFTDPKSSLLLGDNA